MWVKQGLVKQGMYQEQENSHLEWPDHTYVHPYVYRSTTYESQYMETT